MTSLPPSSKYLQRPGEPVEEQERESITKRLSDAYADGRMTQDDYMQCLDVVYAASTLGDLVPVVEKLPAAADNTPDIVRAGAAPAGEVTQSRNVLVPTVMAAGGVLVLLLVLGVLAVMML